MAKSKFPKIKNIMKDIKATTEAMENDKNTKEETSQDTEDYKQWCVNIIKSIEDNDKYDKRSYNKLVAKYPNTKSIVDEMIEQYSIYSLYDYEGNKENFPLKAYFKKIHDTIN